MVMLMLLQLLLCVQKGSSLLLRASMSYERGVLAKGSYSNGPHSSRLFTNFWQESIQKLRFELVPEGSKIGETKTCVGANNGQMVLVDNNSMNSISGEIIATIDIQQPNRAFIGHQLKYGCTDIHTTGGILYFDKDGKQSGLLKTFSDSAIESDCRNGIPRTWDRRNKCILKANEHNLILCGQTLLHVWNFRASGDEVNLSGATMDQDEIKSDFIFHTKCEFMKNPIEKRLLGNAPLLVYLNRWLCFPDADGILCYDMNSFKSSQPIENNYCFPDLTYDAVSLPSTANIPESLESLSDVPSLEPTERNGYPTKCIKCGGDTVQGMMFTDAHSIGLGRAACFSCMIRYSLTNKRWECMKLDAEGERCSAEVHGPNYCCSEPHVPESQYSFRSPDKAERELAKAYNWQLSIDLKVTGMK